jgi:hypothetical protein
MNKIHEKYMLFRSNSVTFLIPKQSSRWFQLNRDRNFTKFIQISYIYASENIKTIYKTYCTSLSFSARERMQPTAVLRTPAWARDPAPNQQAAEPACAPLPPGPNLARERPAAAGRPSRWTPERAFRRDKKPASGAHKTLASFFSFLSPETSSGGAALGWRARRRSPWPARSPASVRSSAVRLKAVGHLFLHYNFPSFFFSPRPHLLPYRRDPERGWPWWPAPVAGSADDGEERRPARSRGRLLLSFFLSYPSP